MKGLQVIVIHMPYSEFHVSQPLPSGWSLSNSPCIFNAASYTTEDLYPLHKNVIVPPVSYVRVSLPLPSGWRILVFLGYPLQYQILQS